MRVLITGARGFLGRNIAKKLSSSGHCVIGCGRGEWHLAQRLEWGIERWVQGNINYEFLEALCETPDVIVHCAGSGSVVRSMVEPYHSFVDTDLSTAAVLEFARVHAPRTHVIVASSPAVQGVHDISAIRTTELGLPVSTYGVHKEIAETLCRSYRKVYGLTATIIRFFSIYGEGLRKQLLWDACGKFTRGGIAEFWGDGQETRDWVHADDASEFVAMVACRSHDTLPPILNCGSGIAHTTRDVLMRLREYLGASAEIEFNGVARQGDPRHYLADLSEAREIGWKPRVSLDEGLRRYTDWYAREA